MAVGDVGGGIYHGKGSTTLVNCILWGNSDNGGMDEAAQIHIASGIVQIDYSAVQGWTGGLGGVGNIGDDPLFVDPDGPDDIPGTEDDDLRLSPGSPSIDAANNTAVPGDSADLDSDGDTTEPTPLDLDRMPRFVDDPNVDDCPQPGADCGTPPIVDMGAYEFQGSGEPIPTVSEWGMAVMALLVLTAGTLVFVWRPASKRELRD